MRQITILFTAMTATVLLTCAVLACTTKDRCWYRIKYSGNEQYGKCQIINPGSQWEGGTEPCKLYTDCPYP